MCNTDSTNFLIAEYSGLRKEILKRTEIQHQLISVTVVALGSVIPLWDKIPANVFLAYPALAMILAAAWSQSDNRIKRIGTYIKDRVEPELLGQDLIKKNFGWEHNYQPPGPIKQFVTLSRIISTGIFIVTQVISVVLFFVKRGSYTYLTKSETVMLISNILIIIVTVFLLFASSWWKERAT